MLFSNFFTYVGFPPFCAVLSTIIPNYPRVNSIYDLKFTSRTLMYYWLLFLRRERNGSPANHPVKKIHKLENCRRNQLIEVTCINFSQVCLDFMVYTGHTLSLFPFVNHFLKSTEIIIELNLVKHFNLQSNKQCNISLQ